MWTVEAIQDGHKARISGPVNPSLNIFVSAAIFYTRTRSIHRTFVERDTKERRIEIPRFGRKDGIG
jgi:hypothetical protein